MSHSFIEGLIIAMVIFSVPPELNVTHFLFTGHAFKNPLSFFSSNCYLNNAS